MEQEDYSKIYEYESMGKEYAGEKACISLTSWKARINTVSKTLYSLVKMCPGFHIVLVLSKDEFPLMEKELPDNLMLFVENKLIELFWIKPNLKSFKKVLFTMDKYRDVPVISADDDCIYTCNYAQELYDKWENNSYVDKIITYNKNSQNIQHATEGPCTFYNTFLLKDFMKFCFSLLDKANPLEDDSLYLRINRQLNINVNYIKSDGWALPFKFHTLESPIHKFYYNSGQWRKFIL